MSQQTQQNTKSINKITTDIAVMKNDLKNVGRQMEENNRIVRSLSQEFKDEFQELTHEIRNSYATKGDVKKLDKRIDTIYSYIKWVALLVGGIIITAVLSGVQL